MLTVKEKRLIDGVYYDLNNGGAFLSPTKVHQVLKSRGFNSPGLYKIRRYIQSLDDYSLQKPVKRSFKRARVEVSGPYEEFQADLADVSNLSKQNGGIRFLLVVIDVFSRFLWVEPIKTKTTKDVLDAFRKIIDRSKKPKRVYTDAGKEFTGNLMKQYCKDNGIKCFISLNEKKASVVERLIRTLKTMMYRYFTKYRTYEYADKLQDFVKSYNATPHSSLNGITPKDVNKTNEADLFAYMYLRKKHTRPSVRKTVQKPKFRFKIGSLVRISHLKQPFTRAYQQQWSSEIFKVKKRFLRQGIPQYQLIDFLNEPIMGNFYQAELQRVDKDETTLWYIEEKLKERKRAGRTEWFVKFEGWPSKYNQWIAEKDITDVSKAEDVTLRSHSQRRK
ncbi:uncharacterized protein LOC117337977 [Pecten maximus]|uniref:uncharacterized protein LOC117337977 n=1 Tax=Pecten maximus TaxID=6579 RepID=UPI0014591B20|nr:uncharacterized protein LOC117337977 [Pecten maximus]